MAKKKRKSAQRHPIARAKRKPVAKRPLYKESPRAAKRTPRPSEWYTSLGAGLDPDARAAKRKATLRYLRDAIAGYPAPVERQGKGRRIPGLREMYPGFDVDLKNLQSLTKKQHDRIQAEAKNLHYLTSAPFRAVKPRTPQQRSTLKHFTQQHVPGQKRFIVHTPSPRYAVKFSTIKRGKKKQSQLNIVTPQRFGGYGKLKFWFFKDYNGGEQPETADEFIQATINMLPDMPDWGYFSLWSQPNGIIGAPQPKNSLVRAFMQYFQEGDSFAGKQEEMSDLLQAWVLQGDEDTAHRVYSARLQRRAKSNRWRDAERNRRRKALGLKAAKTKK